MRRNRTVVGFLLIYLIVIGSTFAQEPPPTIPNPPGGQSGSAGPGAPPASSSVTPGPTPPIAPTNLRGDNNTIQADSTTTPDRTCWALIEGKTSIYQLLNATPTCVAPLNLTRGKVTVDAKGLFSVDGKAVKVIIAVVGKDGPIEPQSLTKSATDPFVFVFVFVDGKSEEIVYAIGVTTASTQVGSSNEVCTFPKFEPQHGEAVVEVDLPHGSVVRAPSRNVLRPNQGLIVRVCHLPDETVSVEWNGSRGLTRSSVEADIMHDGGSTAKVQKPPAVSLPVSTLRFPPRQPGSADLKISSAASGKTAELKLTVELEVEKLYWGAVRFGLGTLFDVSSQWQSYEIATFAGSRQPEIRETHSAVAFELVSGFAPYLIDLAACHGGRSQTGGCNAYGAPYFGFGVIGAAPNQGVQGLSSFHAGFEFEFASNFSIATNFVLRRMRTLTDGYRPGSPVTAGMTIDGVTGESWLPGFAIVINATPSFLQFATGASEPNSSPKPATPSSSTGSAEGG